MYCLGEDQRHGLSPATFKARCLNTGLVKPDAGAGDEITPEMLSAGAAVLSEFYIGDGVYDLCDETISAIYRAMYLLRPLSAHVDY